MDGSPGEGIQGGLRELSGETAKRLRGVLAWDWQFGVPGMGVRHSPHCFWRISVRITDFTYDRLLESGKDYAQVFFISEQSSRRQAGCA